MLMMQACFSKKLMVNRRVIPGKSIIIIEGFDRRHYRLSRYDKHSTLSKSITISISSISIKNINIDKRVCA